MNREANFGRLIAVATVLGDRVFEKDATSIADEFLSRVGKNPAKYIKIIHERLMKYSHKFGAEEMVLLDLFGELIDQLQIEEFSAEPLNYKYLHNYYSQKQLLTIVGYKEAYEILDWDYEKNRTMLNTYLKRAEEKGWPVSMAPKPIQVLASGPVWYKYQIEEYRDSRKRGSEQE